MPYNTGNHSDVCTDVFGKVDQGCGVQAASVDNNPIFDLVTSADISKCSGAPCRAAASALIAYQKVLGPITQMRYDTLEVTQGTSGTVPLIGEVGRGTWTFQRTCTALTSIVKQASYIQSEVPAVVQGLRDVSPQLEMSCVAPVRAKHLIGRAQPGMCRPDTVAHPEDDKPGLHPSVTHPALA